MFKEIIITLLLICVSFIQNSSQSSINEDLIITWEQKLKLDKFKEIMEPHLPQDYMKSEIYLIQWLKVKDFDIPSAVKFLKENLSWRKENNMDTIFTEDWTDYHSEYRFNIEGCDEEGRPLAAMFVGEWDMRKAVISGQSDRMNRYIDKIFEEASTIIRNMQAGGSNATRAILLLDCSSLSLQLQFCPRCLAFYIYLLQTLDQHYPHLVHGAIAFNTPEIIIPIWENILKPVASRRLAELISIYGRNKREWRKALLLKHSIDFTKLSNDVGGDGEDALDLNELRRNGYKFQCEKKLY